MADQNPYADAIDQYVTQQQNNAAPAPVVPAAQPVAPANDNPYGAAVDQYATTQAKSAVLQNQNVDPDEAADADRMAKVLDVSRETILQDMPHYRQQMSVKDQSNQIDNSQPVANFIAKNPQAAPLAKDDFDNLSVIGKLASTFVQTIKQPLLENQIARKQTTQAVEDAFNSDTAETQQDINNLKAQMNAYSLYQPTGIYSKASWLGTQAVSWLDNAIHALPMALAGAGVGAAAGAPVGGVGAIPGAVAGFGIGARAGFALDMARTSAGPVYAALSDIKDADGQPISKTGRLAGTAITAGLVAGLGYGGIGSGVENIAKKAAGNFVTDAVKEAVTRPTVVQALANVAKRVGVGAFEGGVTMGGMTAAQIAGQEIAKQISPGQWQTVANDPALRGQYIDQIASSAEQGALLMGALGGIGGGLAEAGKIHQSMMDMQQFQNLEQASTTSKLRERDANTFSDFLKGQTDGSPVENLYVPHGVVRQLYQSLNTEPGAANDPLSFVPDMQTQLDQAGATNGDIVIPTADYIAHIAGTDVSSALINDIKPRPDGYSLNEAKTYFQGAADRVRQAAAGVEQNYNYEQNQKSGPIAADVTAQLQATNKFTPEQIAQYASLYSKRYETRGARLGVDPNQLYAQEPVKITANAAEAEGGKKFDQAPLDSTRYGARGDYSVGLSANTDSIPGIKRLSEQASAGDGTAHRLLNSIADDSVRHLLGGIPGVQIKSDFNSGLYGGHLEPSLGMHIDFDESTRGNVLAGLAKFAQNFNQQEVHVRQVVSDEPGKIYSDGSYATPVYNIGLNAPLTRDAVQKVIDESGLYGLTYNDGKLEAYYVGHPTDTAAIDTFERGITAAVKSLGSDGSTVDRSVNRLWRYGDTSDAIPYSEIAGDVRAAPARESPTAKRVAERIAEKSVEPTDQAKEISRQQAELQSHIAATFDKLPDNDLGNPLVKRAYDALVKAVRQQYEALPIKVDAFDPKQGEPYKNSAAMRKDVLDNNHLTFYPTTPDTFGPAGVDTTGHPLLEPTGLVSDNGHPMLANDLLRVVHDYYAHLIAPVEFGPRGEEAAWANHMAMTNDPWAKWALTTETRGQNSWVNFNPEAEGKSLADRPFARQKTALLPIEYAMTGKPGIDADMKGLAATLDENQQLGSLPPDQRTLFQGKRGSITFDGMNRIINLFKQSDTSTLLHESGHMWLEELKSDAMREDAPQQLRDDWTTIANAIGYDGGEISTESHEKFAGMTERYFMEGKAPSLDLSDAFSRFKDWLLGIYKSLRNSLPQLNDDVRGVMDRLLATDEEIASTQAVQALRPAFATKEQAGMTDAEFAAYQKIAANARAGATGEMIDKMMAGIRKERSKEYKSRFDDARPAFAEQINQRRDIKALHFLRTGKLLGDEGETEIPAMKLDPQSVIDKMPGMQGSVDDAMPNNILSKGKNGVDPDDAAPLLGYDNGTQLVRDLAKLRYQENAMKLRGIKGSLRDYLTDRATKEALMQRDGDTMNEDSIRDEAMRSLHDQKYGDLIGAEVAAMARQVGQQPIPYKAALDWARGVISDKKLSDAARLSVYAAAERRAGRGVEQALMAGDKVEAFRQKQQQMLNHAMYRAAMEARDDLIKGKKLFDRFANALTIKSVDQGYTDQIHGLLQRYGYGGKRDPAELARAIAGSSLRDFVQSAYENGREVPVADWLFGNPTKGMQDFTTSEFRDFKDAVAGLAHNGREEKTLYVDGKRADKDEIVDKIIDNVKQSHAERKQSKYLNMADAGVLRGTFDKVTSLLRGADAELLKQENFFDWLDNRQILGPLNEYVFRPLKEAQGREYDTLSEISKSFKEMDQPDDWHKTLGDMVDQDKLKNPDTGENYAMSRKTMLSIALNTGNDSNMKKLADGYKWNTADIMDFLHANMTKPDWDFVQHVWDTFDKLKPQIDAMQRRLTGVGLDMIEAKPIDTQFGRYDGGYYPVVYDPAMSKRSLRKESAATSENIFEQDYYRPTTAKGHTMARLQNYTDRMLLSTDVIPSKLKQAVHDLHFREAIINADKILADPRFKQSIRDTWGIEYYKEMRPWLRDIANAPNVDDRPMSFLDKALRYSRMTMVEMGVGFRTTTMLKHGSTAFANSIGEIGPKNMAAGIAEYYSDRSGKQQFVFDRSAEMRHRMAHYDRDVRENLKSLMGEEALTQQIRRFGHYGVSFLDMESAMPTWIGAYRAALRDGLEDKDAIYAADKSVRNAHGAQSTLDMAGVQRGPEYKKMFSMFYGFFNHMYNRERDTYRTARDGVTKLTGGNIAGARRDFTTVLARSMAYLLAPAIVEQTISGQKQSDDESWGKWAGKAVLSQLAATVPVVRDVANYIERGKGPESPISRFVEAMGAQAKDIGAVASGADPSSKWLKHAIETPGYLIGLPTGQLATSAQYLWDVHSGDQSPQDVQDWMHGLVYGKQAK